MQNVGYLDIFNFDSFRFSKVIKFSDSSLDYSNISKLNRPKLLISITHLTIRDFLGILRGIGKWKILRGRGEENFERQGRNFLGRNQLFLHQQGGSHESDGKMILKMQHLT